MDGESKGIRCDICARIACWCGQMAKCCECIILEAGEDSDGDGGDVKLKV